MRRVAWLVAGGLCALIGTQVHGQTREPDILLRRPDGRYYAPDIPGARRGERLEVRPVPGTDRSAVYGRDGRRIGTIERRPHGGSNFYDRDGRRR
jgi:hypothetical protein